MAEPKPPTLPPLPLPNPFPKIPESKEPKPIPPKGQECLPSRTQIKNWAKEDESKFEKEARKRGYVRIDIGKSKIKFREFVPTGWFVAFVITIIFVMWTRNMIIWGNILNDGFYLLIYVVFFGILYLFGVEKPALKQFGVELMKVVYDPTLKIETQMAFVKAKIDQLMGFSIAMKLQETAEKEINGLL